MIKKNRRNNSSNTPNQRVFTIVFISTFVYPLHTPPQWVCVSHSLALILTLYLYLYLPLGLLRIIR